MESNEVSASTSPEIPRAQRYEIGTVIRFRVRGEREWHEGQTENISVSGLLIRSGRALTPGLQLRCVFFFLLSWTANAPRKFSAEGS